MKLTKSRLRQIIKEEIQSLNEMDLDSVRLPSNVKRFTNKLIAQIKRTNLTKPRQYAIVARIIDALGIEVNRLTRVMQVVRKDMKRN